jgi:hypothetical protein
MVGLILQTKRCPDGVALYEDKDRQSEFRYCSTELEDLRLEIRDLENPVVVAFMNARDDQARARFFSEYGIDAMGHGPPAVSRSAVLGWQDKFARLLDHIRNDKPAAVVDAINSFKFWGWRPGDDSPLDWAPILKVIGKKRPPQMFFECRSLPSFMVAETAMAVTNDARVRYCQHCHNLFLTGPLTGRRAHAKFDSDRCRVAAMRARQARRA